MLDNDVKSRTLKEQNVHKEDNWRTSGDEEHQPVSSEQLTVDLQLLPASPGGAGGAASGPVLQDFQVQTQAEGRSPTCGLRGHVHVCTNAQNKLHNPRR